MVEIREFRYEDAERVSEIVLDSLNEFYPRSLYIEKSRQWPEGFIVGVEGGVIIAMLMGSLEGRSESRILIFAVQNPYRSRGIGTQMMDEFVKRSAMKGVRRITLEVRKSNLSAIGFYEKFSFHIEGVLHMYYSDLEDGYRMVKTL